VTGTLVGVVTASVYFLQELLLYHPNMPGREYDELPSNYRLPFEDIEIITDDNVKLHAWLITQSSLDATKNASTLLYFHGNAGNISHRLTDVRNFHNLVKCNILMVSYRGYGRSEGKPSERGLTLDAEAALKVAQKHPSIDSSKVFLFGRSIGGAVAISLASKAANSVRGIIVENTFLSINHMIDSAIPILKVFKMLNRNRWDNLAKVKDTHLPILFLTGRNDELIPPKHSQDLYHASKNAILRKIEFFEGASHNDTWFRGGTRYYETIAEFIEQSLAIDSSDTCSSISKNE